MRTEAHTPFTWKSLLALAALFVALTAAIAAPRADAVPRSFYGVVPQTQLGAQDFERMSQGRVGTVRVLFAWSAVDPTAAVGDYDWSSFDSVVADAAANGVEVLPFLFGTPQWVARDLDGHACGNDCATFAPRSPAALAAWTTFVGDIVARYGANGSFWTEHPQLPRKPITAWQIWNEVNSNEFFAPKAKPKSYAKLLAAAAGAVRGQDPSADVVLAGMAQLAGSSKATKGTSYLRKLYRVRGVKKSFDGLALHPYGASVEKVAAQVDEFREVARTAGDRRVDTWITELGWGSDKGGNPLNRGRKGQADRLKEAFKYFRKNRNKLNVQAVTWFSWADSSVSICDWCASSGLLTEGLGEKPAWRAFTKFTGGR